MRKLFVGLICVFLVYNTTDAHDIADVMNDVLPSVAYIRVDNFTNQEQLDPLTKTLSKIRVPNRPIIGTGFVIDGNIVVTNYPVIAFAVRHNTDVYVSFENSNLKYKAKILGYDKIADIALMEIEGDHPSVQIDDGTELRMGDTVFSISHFYGIGWSGTQGIISSTDRKDIRYPYVNNLQLQLLQGSGSSGGPVFNTDGDVIALNRSIVSMIPRSYLAPLRSPSMLSMVGYPIRADTLLASIEAIQDDIIVVYLDLGVTLLEFGPDSLFHLNYTDGVQFAYGTMVMSVDSDKKIALKESDIIISIEGRTFMDPVNLLVWLNSTGRKPGSDINVQVYRDGEVINIAVQLQLAGL